MDRDLTVLREEERPWGALTHVFAAVPLWGMLLNFGLWLHFRERSRLMLFHVQQALVFQMLALLLAFPWFLLQLLGRVVQSLAPRLGQFLLNTNSVLAMAVITVYVLVCLWGAIRVWATGRFYYPFIGQGIYRGALNKTRVEE